MGPAQIGPNIVGKRHLRLHLSGRPEAPVCRFHQTMSTRFAHQLILAPEVRVEAPVGQPSLGHDLVHPDLIYTVGAKSLRCGRYDRPPGSLLMSTVVPYQRRSPPASDLHQLYMTTIIQK